MGSCNTKPVTATQSEAKKVAAQSEIHRPSTMSSNNDDQVEVELKKHHPGCTGMFWRPDPTGNVSLQSNRNWPRDGAKLRGMVVMVEGEKWLLATHVLQRGDKDWKEAPQGAAMPFEYNSHYYLE